MERTSTRPLAVTKTIARKNKPKDSKRVGLTGAQAIAETKNITRQAQPSPSPLDHGKTDHWGSGQEVKDTESDTLVALLSLLENRDNELKFISAHPSTLDSTQKDGTVYDIEQMKAEDVNRTSLDIVVRFIDSELRSEYILCDEELSRQPAVMLQDEVAEYFPELQQHETDTLSTRYCSTSTLLGHEHGIAPLTTETPFEEREGDYVQNILGDEIRINGNGNYSVQSWTDGNESSFRTEPDFHCFQVSHDSLTERSDHVMMEMSDAEQAEDGNEIYVDQSDGEYPKNEYGEVAYDDDESTIGE